MAYISGVANGHQDLLNRVIDFVTTHEALVTQGQNWQILQSYTDPFGYMLKAPGLSGKEQIYLYISTYQDAKRDCYNWHIGSAQGFDATQKMTEQPKKISRNFLLWNQEIPYWLIANGQRLMVIAKISTVYTMCYLGKFFPYATPNQYPYPVMVAGDSVEYWARWSDTSKEHSTLQSPKSSTVRFYLPNGLNEAVSNDNQNTAKFFPEYNALGDKHINPNQDGSYSLLPYILYLKTYGGNVLGELDGVYWVTGHNNASENMLTIAGETYLVVQNIHRTSWQDYCAIKLG